MNPKLDTNGTQHTLAEWRKLFTEKLRESGFPPKAAARRVKEHLDQQAVGNLNAMARIKGAKILFDAFVMRLRMLPESPSKFLDAALTPAQKKLQKKHGTPAQFAVAVYNCVPGDISMDEARAAVDKYNAEWKAAQ